MLLDTLSDNFVRAAGRIFVRIAGHSLAYDHRTPNLFCGTRLWWRLNRHEVKRRVTGAAQ